MNVDHGEIMRRVAEIAPKLAERAVACDEARQVVAENMRAMIAAGMFRIPQPARVGGYELSLRTLGAAVTALSRVCSSSDQFTGGLKAIAYGNACSGQLSSLDLLTT